MGRGTVPPDRVFERISLFPHIFTVGGGVCGISDKVFVLGDEVLEDIVGRLKSMPGPSGSHVPLTHSPLHHPALFLGVSLFLLSLPSTPAPPHPGFFSVTAALRPASQPARPTYNAPPHCLILAPYSQAAERCTSPLRSLKSFCKSLKTIFAKRHPNDRCPKRRPPRGLPKSVPLVGWVGGGVKVHWCTPSQAAPPPHT